MRETSVNSRTQLLLAVLRRSISEGTTLEGLRHAARTSGLVSLRTRAIELVQEGLIDFDTLPRFIPIDRLGRPRTRLPPLRCGAGHSS